MTKKKRALCAACGKRSERNHSVHRDGFEIGPEVWLCDACGSHPTPTLRELWASIRHRYLEGFEMSYCDHDD